MRPSRIAMALLGILVVAATSSCGSTTDRACGAAQDALEQLAAIARSGNVSTQTPEWTAAAGHLQRMAREAEGSGNGWLDLRTTRMMQRFLAVEQAPTDAARRQAFVQAWGSLGPVADTCRLAGLPLRAPPRGP